MCNDLEAKARDFAQSCVGNLTLSDFSTIDVVKDLISHAYEQGYADSSIYMCYNRICRDRILND